MNKLGLLQKIIRVVDNWFNLMRKKNADLPAVTTQYTNINI